MEQAIEQLNSKEPPKESFFFDKLRIILKDEKDMALTDLFNDMSCFDVDCPEIKESLCTVYSDAFLDDAQYNKMEKMVKEYIDCYDTENRNGLSAFALGIKALDIYFEIFKYIYIINSDDEQRIERKLYYNFAIRRFKLDDVKKVILDLPFIKYDGTKYVPEGTKFVPIVKASYAFDSILFIKKNAEFFQEWLKDSEIRNREYLKNMYCYLFECKAYRKVKRYHMVLDDGDIRKNYIINADNNRHRIECMDCAEKTGVETIRPMRLVEKICDFIDNNPRKSELKDYKITVIGNLDYKNDFLDERYSSEIVEMVYLLEQIFEENGFNGTVSIDWYLKDANTKTDKETHSIEISKGKIKTCIILKSREEIAKKLENATELKELVSKNDILFLLDCYELYQSLDFEKRSDSLYGKEFFDDIKKRYSACFDNVEYSQSLQHKTYLERLMTQLNGVEINPFAYSGNIRRTFKKAVIDFLQNVVNEQKEYKKVYVYFDNGKRICETDYPKWQIMRLETYNDKLIQIAQISYKNKRRNLEYLSDDDKLYFNMHKMIKNLCIEYYYYITQDIFKMKNNKTEISIMDKEDSAKAEKAVALIAYAFQKVCVCINYAKVNDIQIGFRINYDKLEKVSVKLWKVIMGNDLSYDASLFYKLIEIVKETTIEFLNWAFEVRKSDNYMLNDAYRNDFKAVLNNASVSVNDMLFTEIYSDLDFEISADVEEITTDYYNKEHNTMEFAIDRVAYSYVIKQIRQLSITTETNIRVLCNNYQLDYKGMLGNIIKACKKFNLTDTQLYQNAAILFNS